MREGKAYRVAFGTGSLFDTVVMVVSFEDGDDAISLARVAAECDNALRSVELVGPTWVNA